MKVNLREVDTVYKPNPNLRSRISYMTQFVSTHAHMHSSKPALLDVLNAPDIKKDEIYSNNYVLLNGDLRDMNSVGDRMVAAGLNKALPTMFLTECVLIYMEPEKSREVIKWVGTNFITSLFLNYEPVRRLF